MSKLYGWWSNNAYTSWRKNPFKFSDGSTPGTVWYLTPNADEVECCWVATSDTEHGTAWPDARCLGEVTFCTRPNMPTRAPHGPSEPLRGPDPVLSTPEAGESL